MGKLKWKSQQLYDTDLLAAFIAISPVSRNVFISAGMAVFTANKSTTRLVDEHCTPSLHIVPLLVNETSRNGG